MNLRTVLTPPAVIRQLSLAVPLLLLYEGSIISVRVVEKKAAAEAAAKEAEAKATEAADAAKEAAKEASKNDTAVTPAE